MNNSIAKNEMNITMFIKINCLNNIVNNSQFANKFNNNSSP